MQLPKIAIAKLLVVVLALNTCVLMLPRSAGAGMVGTAALLDPPARAEALAGIRATLERAEVRERLVGWGVTPEAAMARVQALSDREVAALAAELEQAPAGGVLAVIGAVFVVLIVLELVGVTDVFSKL